MKYLCLLSFLFFAIGKGGRDAAAERTVYVRADTGADPFKSYVVLFKVNGAYKIIHTERVSNGLYVKAIASGEFSRAQISFTVDSKTELHYSHTPYILGDFIQKDSVVKVKDYMANYWGDVYEDSITLKSANIYAGKASDDHGVYHLVK